MDTLMHTPDNMITPIIWMT